MHAISSPIDWNRCLFDWYDFIDHKDDLVTEEEMIWCKYPSDDEIADVGVRGIYLGNYLIKIRIS